MLDYIKLLLREKETASTVFRRNLVKEYLQILILSFLYSHEDYRNLVFYGGSSLRHCYGLPRLSEDLDFVDIEKRIELLGLAEDLRKFFFNKYEVKVEAKVQKFRCTLKFPVLHVLSLAKSQESNLLFSKIEVYSELGFCKEYGVEIRPLFKFGEALLLKTFNLPTLMATKIRAIMHRKWERTTKNGRILAEVKGRDYYDLMWYLEQGVKPNLRCIEGITEEPELYEELIKIVRRINPQSIKYDLEGLVEDPGFLDTLKNNIKEVLISLLNRRLPSAETK
jgi:predicted nucleotidyltransferase component of viral defense system